MNIIGTLRLANMTVSSGSGATLAWVTPAGNLGFWDDTPISVVASASNGASVTYTLIVSKGFLPVGITFDSSTGIFSGTVSEPEGYSDFEFVFRIEARTVGGVAPITRTFSISFPTYFAP